MPLKRPLIIALILGPLAAPALAQPLVKLKVGAGQRGVGESMTPEIGQLAGIFKKHGLDVEVFYTAGSGETIQTVVSGSADIGVATGVSGAIGAFSRGAPVRIVGATFTGDSNLFWYVKADSPLKSPKEADGKTVAYSTNGSSTHNVVLQMQKMLGAKFQLTSTGNAPATFAQVMSGQIDVGWSGAPFAVEALEQGRIRQLWLASDIPAIRGTTSRVMIANTRLMKETPKVVQQFLDAYRETLTYIYTTPEGVKAYARWAEIPEAVAQRTLKEFVPIEAANPDEVKGLQETMKDAVEFKYIPAMLTEAQVKELVQIPPRKP